ncbi:MAG: class I SAM-dependent methyltransferase [Lapillicoccus sp.]
MAHPPPPPTRWETHVTGERWDFYVERFARHVTDGDDLEGEARFLDMMAPRGAAIFDGGTGTGRVAAALHRMGHRVIGVDRDTGLLEVARRSHPGVAYLSSDLLEITPDLLATHGFADPFDIVALPGNVLVYVAPGTERQVLATMFALLRPGGRLVAGFATDRDYRVSDLDRDSSAVGFVLEHRFATWHLDPWAADSDWHVSVVRRPDDGCVD